MESALQKITTFIQQHHVMSLATCNEDEVSACSVFYVYDVDTQRFVFASAEETLHVKHFYHNPHVAGNIFLETKNVGEIRGLQIKGTVEQLHRPHLKTLYFKAYPYAKLLQPQLWELEVKQFKFTDNRLGFGKKIIWPQ